MPSVGQLTALYGNFMLSPRRGPGVCDVCFNLTDGYTRCYACTQGELWLDTVAPISYSVALEQLHHSLRAYKRKPAESETARHLATGLAAVLWRFLDSHERCVAAASKTRAFDRVTSVPSGDHVRGDDHPLGRIVGSLSAPTRSRYERLLTRTPAIVRRHEFDAHRFEATRAVGGESILLIDDTWTTGASAQSAAAALKRAGAQRVAAVVIGRHLNPEWHARDGRLRRLSRPYDWTRCALCEATD